MTGGLVAVVFSDVVSSTELWSTLGDAHADDVRRRVRVASEAAVAEFGGVVVKDLGDGLMVTFPTASASLDGAVAVQRASARVARTTGVVDLRLRVGVSIGEATRDGDDWFGVPVVEAARLCGAADPGQVLATDTVVLLARRSDQTCRPLGPRPLKGLPEPVPVSEVKWADDGEAEAAVPALLRRHADDMAFTGRDAAVAALRQAFDGASDRHLVLVSGEPGIGKTRLVGEFAAEVVASGGVVLAVGHEEGHNDLRRSLARALADLAEAHDPPGSVRAVLATLLPELLDAGHPFPDGRGNEPGVLAHAVATWLVEVASRRRVVFVADDLHWASADSLHLLQHLTAGLDRAEVLVVGTYRDTDLARSHPMAAWLADRRRDDPPRRIDLDGLATEDIVSILTARSTSPLPDDALRLVQAVHRETEGNPFFLGQVLDQLTDDGDLELCDGAWHVTTDVAHIGLPQGVREVVGQRLDRLPDGVDDVLAVAAVQGRSFSLRVTRAALDGDLDRVVDSLDATERAGLVRAEPGSVDRFTFAHALIRHTIVEELSVLHRARLHLLVAQALDETLGPDEDNYARPIHDVLPAVEHYLDAAALGGLPRAIELLHSIDRFLAMGPFHALALRSLSAAEELALDDRHLAMAHIQVAMSAALAGGRRDVVSRSFREAVRLAEPLGDPKLYAQAVAAGESAAGFGLSPDFLRLAPLALETIDPCSRTGLQLRVAMLQTHAFFVPPGVDVVAEYLTLIEDCPPTEASRIGALAGMALHSSPDVATAQRLHRETTPTEAGSVGHFWAQVRTDLTSSDRVLEDWAAVAALTGGSETFAAARSQAKALVALAGGRFDEADGHIDEVARLAGDEPMFALGIPWQRAIVATWRGDAARAPDLSEPIRPFSPYPRNATLFWALLDRDLGDLDAARRGFAEGWADGPDSVGRDWMYTATISKLTELAADFGTEAQATELDALLEPFDGQFLLDSCLALRGSVSWLRARLAERVGDLDEAERHYERAEAFEAAQGALPMLERTRRDLSALRSRR